MTTEQITTRGRVRANKLHAGLLIRKPRPYKGYNICEWTRIAHIRRNDSGNFVLYGADGRPIDTIRQDGNERPVGWPASSAFEIGQLANDDDEQDARNAATQPQIRGWLRIEDLH